MPNYQQKPPSCNGCPWEHLSIGYATGSGPSNAKLAVIAESLGENEAIQGIPLVGYTGQEVNKFLSDNGALRQETYCDNVVRCKPPIGKGKKIPKEVIKFCTERHLKPALQLVKPNAIIALGEYSLNYLSGKRGISRRRGSILNTTFGKVIPTFHPSWLHKGENAIIMWPFVSFDFGKGIKEAKTAEYSPPAENFNIAPTIDDIRELKKAAQDEGKVAVDIETSAGSWWNTAPLCIGFYISKCNRAICVPFFGQYGVSIWKDDELLEIIVLIDSILGDESIEKILQNGNYDIKVLEDVGFKVRNFAFDTMIAHHAIIAEKGVPHTLDFISSIYTDTPYYKDDVKGEDNFALHPETTLRTYNCRDCRVTGLSASELDLELDEYGVRETFNQDMAMLLPMRRMEKRGILIETTLLAKYRAETLQEIEEAKSDIKRILGGEFNPGSGKQMRKFLFEDLKLEPVSYTKSKIPAVDFDSLMQLTDQVSGNLEILLALFLRLRKVEKQHSTYFKEFILDYNNRIHTNLLLHVTPTGRLSSRNPNLQNQPDGRAKQLFISQFGFEFLSRDYSQIELRILAYLTNDESLIEIFESGKDPHLQNASDLFGIPINKVTEQQRDASKIFVYGGVIYGGTAGTIRAQMRSRALKEIWEKKLPISQIKKMAIPSTEEVKRVQGNWLEKHPNIGKFQREIEVEVLKNRKLTIPIGGRVRYFLGKKENIVRSGYNTPIQGSAAGVINPALVTLDSLVPDPNGISLQVHDELLLEVRESEIDKYVELSKNVMEKPIKLNGREIVFPTSCKVGYYWEGLKKYV